MDLSPPVTAGGVRIRYADHFTFTASQRDNRLLLATLGGCCFLAAAVGCSQFILIGGTLDAIYNRNPVDPTLGYRHAAPR